jgi:hypothetical protein
MAPHRPIWPLRPDSLIADWRLLDRHDPSCFQPCPRRNSQEHLEIDASACFNTPPALKNAPD